MKVALVLLIAASAFASNDDEGVLRDLPEVQGKAAQSREASSRLDLILSDPAKFVVEKTYLSNADKFKKFVADKKAASAFLADKSTQFIARSSWAVKRLAQPNLVDAVVGSPAMQDKKAVSYLFSKSSIPMNLARMEGVRAALEDSEVMGRVCTPSLKKWLEKNPAAASVLKAQSPALATAVSKVATK
jgi:hypothetical protein